MSANSRSEPIEELAFGDARVTLLGTAHVSRTSAETVASLLSSGDYDAVAVELCPSRHEALLNPDVLARMDLLRIIRDGRASMAAAQLALGAYQQRLAEQFGIEPGAEMRAAVDLARAAHLPVLLIDREIGVTLKRVLRNLSWWKRPGLFAALLASVVSREDVDEEDIERLKEGDILETTFSEFAEDRRELFDPLIAERDRYMAASLVRSIRDGGHRNILGVVGAGHLRGIREALEAGVDDPDARIAELDQVPPPSRWPRLIPWLVVGLVAAGFIVGFHRSPELGWTLVGDWVLINGGLAALGAVLALAHPATVVTAFLAAPLTSLNPAVGAGMVTAAAEIVLKRPQMGDFQRLRHDTVHWRGWWRNRVSRTLLVFLFSTLGSAVGTYLAGFRIFDRLTS
jgi:pheromone shutdown-related protein TraB